MCGIHASDGEQRGGQDRIDLGRGLVGARDGWFHGEGRAVTTPRSSSRAHADGRRRGRGGRSRGLPGATNGRAHGGDRTTCLPRVRQDFGFYNLAMALLFALCAVNPERNIVVLPAAIGALTAVHGGTHLLRDLGLYYGGEVLRPTRPRHFELRTHCPLCGRAFAGVLIFLCRLSRIC